MTQQLQTEFIGKEKEVTEKEYYDMLGALPPKRMIINAFLVGEPYDHAKDLSGKFGARYDLYFMHEDKYYHGGLASVGDFDAFVITK